MEMAILADPRRKEKDQPVIDEAEKALGKENVIYAPITEVRLDLSKEITVKFQGKDLNDLDFVLPIPTITYYELFYTSLWMLKDQRLPFDHDKYLLLTNQEVLYNFLGSRGINVRKFVTVASDASLDKVEEIIKFPVIVRPPKKRVVVNNKRTLKDVISLYKTGTPIRVEKPIKASRNVWLFVMNNEVLGGYEKKKGSYKRHVPEKRLANISKRARRALGCDYCAMRFLRSKKKWVLDKVVLSPNFAHFQKVSDTNIARHMISHCVMKGGRPEKPWWQERIEEILKIKSA